MTDKFYGRGFVDIKEDKPKTTKKPAAKKAVSKKASAKKAVKKTASKKATKKPAKKTIRKPIPKSVKSEFKSGPAETVLNLKDGNFYEEMPKDVPVKERKFWRRFFGF